MDINPPPRSTRNFPNQSSFYQTEITQYSANFQFQFPQFQLFLQISQTPEISSQTKQIEVHPSTVIYPSTHPWTPSPNPPEAGATRPRGPAAKRSWRDPYVALQDIPAPRAEKSASAVGPALVDVGFGEQKFKQTLAVKWTWNSTTKPQ